METELFRDRIDAGAKLAKHLKEFKGSDTFVLAIPKSGVPIGCEVARILNSQFDVIVTRRIPIPWNPETSMGAISTNGAKVLNDALIRGLDISSEEIDEAAAQVQKEIDRQFNEYRTDKAIPDLLNRTVIIIDDGLVSGYTMLAAIESVKLHKPKSIITAVPVATKSAVKLISPKVDSLIVLIHGENLPFKVKDYYAIWNDLTDDNVISCLD